MALAVPDHMSRKAGWAQFHEGDSMLIAMSGLAELQQEMAHEVSELRRVVVVQASQVQRLAAVAEVPEGVCRGRVRFMAVFLLGLMVPWVARIRGGGKSHIRLRVRSDTSRCRDDADGAAPAFAKRKWSFSAYASATRARMPPPAALLRSAFLRGPWGRRRVNATDSSCGRIA